MTEVIQNGLFYQINKTSHTASLMLWRSNHNVEIPKSIKYENEEFMVDKIIGSNKCYSNCSYYDITLITIPDYSLISEICDKAFAGFKNLTKIKIPPHV